MTREAQYWRDRADRIRSYYPACWSPWTNEWDALREATKHADAALQAESDGTAWWLRRKARAR